MRSGVATSVELLLYSHAEDASPRSLELTRISGPVWHVFVPGVFAGQLYGYRVHGPFDLSRGSRCNPAKVLMDPYARAVGRELAWSEVEEGSADPLCGGALVPDGRDTVLAAPLGMVTDGVAAVWRRPGISDSDRVIYEAHVRGLTMLHEGVPEELRGTYLGAGHEAVIAHLRELGVTSLQLLPVHAIVNDERLHRLGLRQYWGYNTLSFFAPEPRYATAPERATEEFRQMVSQLHEAGIEVIIDVVFNHTGEGNEHGPTLNLRGLDNMAYYRLEQDDPGRYRDFTGTGNSTDLSSPAMLQLVLDSLRYWHTSMGVDGFRFDLAVTLGRSRDARFDPSGTFFQAAQQDPQLAAARFYAEPWDLGQGGYQSGRFPWPWFEHNGKYRDVTRALWRGSPGVHDVLATRLAGSSDLYRASGRRPHHSVNFVTVHDGFTLNDLVSYERKHNHANLEDNRDGSDHNQSQNCGVEGPTDDEAVLDTRDRLRRGMLATLFLSAGTPLLLGGDELSRTQGGNNNAYCQDNEISWFQWRLDPRQDEFLAFVRAMVAFRRRYPQLTRSNWLTGRDGANGERDVVWFGASGQEMTREEWESAERVTLAARLAGVEDEPGDAGRSLLVIVHGDSDEHFTLPPGDWEFLFCTGGESAFRPLGARSRGGGLHGGSAAALEGFAVTVLGQVTQST